MNIKKVISCDWGTSSFRLRLINAETKAVLAETKSAQGIAATYALWKEEKNADRFSFYVYVILSHILELEQQYKYSLDGVTIIISGMASATIGMMELPYKSIPFNVKKAELEMHFTPASESCRHKIIIISGVRSANDVMRGEETIIAGCAIEDIPQVQLFIFPGTHSKHVTVQNGMITDVKTYMTGEVFELLSTKSILSASVEKDNSTETNNTSFIKGIKESVDANLLNNIFHVRTNSLFESHTKKENYHYLSGLLIGEELKNIQATNYMSVTIVSTGSLLPLYLDALSALGLKEKLRQQNADEALVNGQVFVFNHYL